MNPNTERESKNAIPVFSFVAFSGTGKTTFLERLIPELKRLQLRVAVLKHDAHDFDIDVPGKDTHRMTDAGADVVMITSGTHAAVMENRRVEPEELIEKLTCVDMVITEGYKSGHWPKILLYRQAVGKPPAVPPESCVAVVSDTALKTTAPCFGFDDYKELAEYLAEKVKRHCEE